jgi:outer membrane biosynthesis protein TonB
MQKFTIAFVAAVSLFTIGCKKGKGGAGEAVAKMEEFQKKMCDCKDKACADKVNEEMTKWGTEMAKNAGKGDAKPDPEIAKKSADIMTKYTECMTKLMMAGAGGGGSAEPVKKDEPKKDEPAKADAGSGDATKDEPKKDEPKKDEPKKDEPAKAEPAKAEPAKAEPAKAEPAKADKKPDDKKGGGW